jgi:diaminohydroxyphosphoribosylaminopyrimidine deaminase/5-amino-6-(5-phosphoribosylamino)uracil reductase
MIRAKDRGWMEMAYGLAEKARGRTSPNPMVGAVVVRDGAVAGLGYHAEPGKPHAEIIALGMAGRRARGATLYLTLEPCIHWGRTGPCIDTVVAAGLSRVVVSAIDPNPLMNGQGIRRLEAAGLDVSVGLLADRHAALNQAHIKWIVRKLPFVTLKAALSLDGRIACAGGDAKWISSAGTRDYVHLLRGENDALLVGINTLIADDPLLSVRHEAWPGKAITRVVLDSGLRFPLTSRILSTLDRGRLLVFSSAEAPPDKARALEALGVEVLAPRDGAAAWSLHGVLAELGRREITALLVEGGSRVFTAFIEERLADKAVLTLAPRFVGGRDAPPLIGGEGVARIAQAIPLRRTRSFTIEDDLILEGYF